MTDHHGLDNENQVFFYENDFYVLSNFSSFRLMWKGENFDTSEHAYHWEKFSGYPEIQGQIRDCRSAHDAFRLASNLVESRRPDWDEIKVSVMRDILRAKYQQHEYVRHKLLMTGNRELIENSWRDDFWGWGVNRNGKNMLGKLWMEIRAECTLFSSIHKPHHWQICTPGSPQDRAMKAIGIENTMHPVSEKQKEAILKITKAILDYERPLKEEQEQG